MRSLLYIELQKMVLRPRSYIAFLAIGIIVAVIEAGIGLEGAELLDLFIRNLKETFVLQGNLLNGYLVTYLVLNSLWIHIPILIALVTGDLVSGEAQAGTFRILLTRPISRNQLLTAKFLAGLLYAALAVLFLALCSLGGGLLFFGKGDLIVFYGTLNILPESELFWRFAAAFGYGILSMWVVAALAFWFSSLSSQSLGPILATVAVLIGFTIISSFEGGLFSTLQPFLFTTYLNKWQAFFAFEVNMEAITSSLLVLVAHVGGFYALSLIGFARRDILT